MKERRSLNWPWRLAAVTFPLPLGKNRVWCLKGTGFAFPSRAAGKASELFAAPEKPSLITAGGSGMKEQLATWLNSIVFACLVIVLAASLSGFTLPYAAFLIQVLLGGFIGGVTNKIAITMLFEKKWYLPGSGVLLEKHKAIVRSLASTVEKHLVNSEMLEAEMRKLLKPVNADKAEQIANTVLNELRDVIRRYLQSSKIHNEIRAALESKLGFVGKFLHATRIKEYDEMARQIVAELVARTERLRVSREMIFATIEKTGTLEAFLFKPNNEFVQRHCGTDRSLSQLFFDSLDIRGMVTEKLSTYAPSQVRDIIQENIGSHLLWLEVFGVLLGMLFSGGLYFMMRGLSIPV